LAFPRKPEDTRYFYVNLIYLVDQVAQLMKMLKALHENKMKERHKVMRARAQKHEKMMGKIDSKRQQKQKEVKKQIYRHLGKVEKRKNKYQKD
jgi:hypothetical protein